jgi:hypothetical protein
MPRGEREKELARRRKRKKEREKLRAKGLLPPTSPKEAVIEAGKKPEKAATKPKEASQEAPKAVNEPSTPEG